MKPVRVAAAPASTVEEKVVDAAVAEAAVLAAVSVSGGTPSSTPSWLAVTGLAGAVAKRRVDVSAKARRRVGVSRRAALIADGKRRRAPSPARVRALVACGRGVEENGQKKSERQVIR